MVMVIVSSSHPIVAVDRHRGIELRVGHEGEDAVEGDAADGAEAVDVAEVDFSREEEEGAEEEAEDYGAEEVAVVHYVLVDAGEGVEDCEGLCGYERGKSGQLEGFP